MEYTDYFLHERTSNLIINRNCIINKKKKQLSIKINETSTINVLEGLE